MIYSYYYFESFAPLPPSLTENDTFGSPPRLPHYTSASRVPPLLPSVSITEE